MTNHIGLARYANDYYVAAQAADDALSQERNRQTAASMPAMFLVAHAVELALKAYILWSDGEKSNLKKYGHDLQICWNEAVKRDVTAHVSLTAQDLAILQLLSDLHISTELRYIQTGPKQLPTFGSLEELCERLLHGISPVVGWRLKQMPGRP